MEQDKTQEVLNPGGEHPMVTFAQENASKLLMLTIWKARKEYPGLAVKITGPDMAEFTRQYTQNGQRPVLAVEGTKDAVILRVIDEETGRMVVTQAGDPNHPSAVMQRKSMELRKNINSLCERLTKATETTGSTRKKALIMEAVDALRTLTWEPER